MSGSIRTEWRCTFKPKNFKAQNTTASAVGRLVLGLLAAGVIVVGVLILKSKIDLGKLSNGVHLGISWGTIGVGSLAICFPIAFKRVKVEAPTNQPPVVVPPQAHAVAPLPVLPAPAPVPVAAKPILVSLDLQNKVDAIFAQLLPEQLKGIQRELNNDSSDNMVLGALLSLMLPAYDQVNTVFEQAKANDSTRDAVCGEAFRKACAQKGVNAAPVPPQPQPQPPPQPPPQPQPPPLPVPTPPQAVAPVTPPPPQPSLLQQNFAPNLAFINPMLQTPKPTSPPLPLPPAQPPAPFHPLNNPVATPQLQPPPQNGPEGWNQPFKPAAGLPPGGPGSGFVGGPGLPPPGGPGSGFVGGPGLLPPPGGPGMNGLNALGNGGLKGPTFAYKGQIMKGGAGPGFTPMDPKNQQN